MIPSVSSGVHFPRRSSHSSYDPDTAIVSVVGRSWLGVSNVLKVKHNPSMRLKRDGRRKWMVANPDEEAAVSLLMLSNKHVNVRSVPVDEGASISHDDVFGVKLKTARRDTDPSLKRKNKSYDKDIYVSGGSTRESIRTAEGVSEKPNLCVLQTEQLLSSSEKSILMSLKFDQLAKCNRHALLGVIKTKVSKRCSRSLVKNPPIGTVRKINTVYLAMPRQYGSMSIEDVPCNIWEWDFLSNKTDSNDTKLFREDVCGRIFWKINEIERWVLGLSDELRQSLYAIASYRVSLEEYKCIRHMFTSLTKRGMTYIFFPGTSAVNNDNSLTDRCLSPAFKQAASAFLIATKTKQRVARVLSSKEGKMIECLRSGEFSNIQQVESMLSHLKRHLGKTRYNSCLHDAIRYLANRNITA